ncbi:MAG: nucleotide pyrophosphohydrolase [Muribaculaceae bacterium]|nr:nucleotide pyrophosphohydrolase [Muribaculaceae bacterium]MDE7386747.1 nucleotide pyrophosphohydrolase [Muribaculaceae bacterium]
MEISELQKTVDQWITGTGGGYFSPLTNTAVLAEETGEVARIMARRYGDQVAKPGDKSDLADELADVMWVVTAIANQTGIDLTEAIKKNIEKKNQRDTDRFNCRQ